VKDTSVSLGLNLLDGEINSMMVSFDMQSKQRLSSLEQSPAPLGPVGFLQIEKRCPVEVDTNGIFIGILPDSATASSGTVAPAFRKGILIRSSHLLSVQCTLPASLVITVPLSLVKPIAGADGAAASGDSRSPLRDRTKSSESQSSQSDSVHVQTELISPPLWEWVGEKSGLVHQQIDTYFKHVAGDASNPGPVNEFRICVACGDRMQRDALALSIRALATLELTATIRERMESLPWYGAAAAPVASSAHSTAGSELGARLKELEVENKSLKRERDELMLQLLENSAESGNSSSTSRLPIGGGSLQIVSNDDFSSEHGGDEEGLPASQSTPLKSGAAEGAGEDASAAAGAGGAAVGESTPSQQLKYRQKIRELEGELLEARKKEASLVLILSLMHLCGLTVLKN
jgi:hypothetical protein